MPQAGLGALVSTGERPRLDWEHWCVLVNVMAPKKKSSSQRDQGGKIESMISEAAGHLSRKGTEALFDAIVSDDDDLPLKDAEKTFCKTSSGVVGCLAQKGVEALFDAIVSDDDDDDNPLLTGAFKIVFKMMAAVVGGLAQKGVEALFDAIGRGNEKTTKALEYKTDETSQELVKTVKSLQECVKELQESRQRESLLLKTYLEKNQGRRNKKKTTKAPESKTDETSQELIKTAKALQECLKELKESRQRECQLRAKLEKYEGKKEEEISSAEMISKFEQLLQRMENVEKHLQKLPESSA